MKHGGLIGVFVFGSYGRGDHDDTSDLDILAVVENGKGRVPTDKVLKYLPPILRHLPPEISWYGQSRVRNMFEGGELFAWHLHGDAQPIFDPSGFLRSLGTPKQYVAAIEDIKSFQSLLDGVPQQLRSAPWNRVYEAGLVYICARNIAMSASAVLLDAPDFSRNSPLNLRDSAPFPLTVTEYSELMHCRLAGQRGQQIPHLNDVGAVISVHARVSAWAELVLDRVEQEMLHD